MKRLLLLSSLVFASCQKVPAGHVGVKVYLLGGEKGVDSEELGVGRYWIGVNEELYLFPTFKQNYVWTNDEREESEEKEGFTFQTVDGMEIGADVGITYHLDSKKVHQIFQKYRRGIDEITSKFLRNQIRDAMVEVGSTMQVEHVYGKGKAEMLEKVTDKVREAVSTEGIIIEKLYFIGKFRLPEVITTAINAKIQAKQLTMQRQNEVEKVKAEADKAREEAKGKADAILIKAKAEAKANEIITKSINRTLLDYKKIDKWNGILPKVSGEAIPLISLSE